MLTGYRERGILRRMATTPVRPAALLGAQMGLHGAAGLLSALLSLLVGKLAFDVKLPSQAGGYLLALLLAVLTALAMGALASALARTAKTANTIGAALFFPMMFSAGVWLPVQAMPDVLRHIVEVLPFGAAAQALHQATVGDWPGWSHLGVMALWTVVVCVPPPAGSAGSDGPEPGRRTARPPRAVRAGGRTPAADVDARQLLGGNRPVPDTVRMTSRDRGANGIDRPGTAPPARNVGGAAGAASVTDVMAVVASGAAAPAAPAAVLASPPGSVPGPADGHRVTIGSVGAAVENRWAAFSRWGTNLLLAASIAAGLGTGGLLGMSGTGMRVFLVVAAAATVLQAWWTRVSRRYSGPSRAGALYYYARWSAGAVLTCLNPFCSIYAVTG